MGSDCIFCRIIHGEEEATWVYQDEQAVAFADLFPLEEGHLLVVPRVHVATIYELEEALAGHLFQVATRLAKVLKQVLRPDGLTILQANERAGGQEVFHFHLHLIPRRLGRRIFALQVARTRARRADLERLFTPVRKALEEGSP